MSVFTLSAPIRLPAQGTVGLNASTSYGSAATPTLATLSGADTAQINVASSYTVTLNVAAEQSYTVTWLQTGSATIVPTTSVITAGQSSATASYTWPSGVSGTVDFTISPNLTRVGRPKTVTFVAAPEPVSGVVQFVAHDGDMVGNVVGNDGTPRSSAPTRSFWNAVLRLYWPNDGGSWLDASQTEQGSTAFASSSSLSGTGRVSITVTSLVQRWQATRQNRGMFVKSRSIAWPVTFAGRTAATDADRPKLTVVTETGTFVLTARANASWDVGSYAVISQSDTWTVAQGQQYALLHFDLSPVVGTVSSATLGITPQSYGGGNSGQVIDIFEANPPEMQDPADFSVSATGLYASGWSALVAHADTLFAKDWAVGQMDTAKLAYFDARSTDPVTGRTTAQAHIASGDNLGVDYKIDILKAASTGGVTIEADRMTEMYGSYRLRLADASTTDGIKIPCIGAQLGYWKTTSGGYWETNQTGGNGGVPATGLKGQDGSPGTGYWYSGHSTRMVVGLKAADGSVYADYVSLDFYPYNLDQGGINPSYERIGNVVLKLGTWYTFLPYMALNTMTGSTDSLGNYATANLDGQFALDINGVEVFTSTKRWVKHPEFGMQGMWLDVYHGGTADAPYRIDYELGEVVLATSYIGPPPAYPWAASIASNTWTSLSADSAYQWGEVEDGIPGSYYPNNYAALRNYINDYCGPAHDEAGASYYYGGGHNSGFMNGVVKFDWKTLQWSLVVDPTPSAKIPASGGVPVGTYPSGAPIIWYVPAPPLTDAADLPYATPLARPSTHMYRAAAKRGSEVWYFYNGFGIADVAAGVWRGYDLRGVFEAQCTALYAGDTGAVFQQGTVALYDEDTDRFFVTRGPGDTASPNAIVVIDPVALEVTNYLIPSSTLGGTYGNVYASMGAAKCGRWIYYFNKTNGNYGSSNSMNQGFRLNMDTLAMEAFSVTGSTSGTVWTDNGYSETIPTGSDGTLIWRWNYANDATHAYKIDPSSYTGSGASASPRVFTQTQVTLSGSPPSPKLMYELTYLPGAGVFAFEPHAEAAPVAIRLA